MKDIKVNVKMPWYIAIFQVTLVVVKLFKIVDWSWWVIFIPLIAYTAFAILVIIIFGIYIAFK